ncbi:peroxidase 6 [Citrus sinensis]|nr:peroxidase 6 [Citrus x clementina]XP_006483776.2 peroxidase 6 [Citrus sinensis]
MNVNFPITFVFCSLQLSYQTMAQFSSISIVLISCSFLTIIQRTQSQLALNYYNSTCPQFPLIMQQVITDKQLSAPATAAGVLRLFLHDCLVDGCDASVLITSNAFHKSERDADVNLPLPGDAFDLVTRAKTALELQCPGVVSCSDIISVATRNLLVMVGGPHYKVLLGRKDSIVSDASHVQGNIPTTNLSLSQIIDVFGSKGLSVQEMVALVGGHTIGFAHCKEFADRIFNFSKTSQSDPAMNPQYADRLRKLCENYTKQPEMSAFIDVFTPGKFDNMYYKNLKHGLGLLQTDQDIAVDGRTKPFVDLYAANETAFFQAFANAMEKLGVYNLKQGNDGEVRHRCHEFTNLNAHQVAKDRYLGDL